METINCTDLDAEIARLQNEGYRLDMIMPADAPRLAYLSRGKERIKLTSIPKSETPNPKSNAGRAGMEYRDLIPDRLGGKVIASRIRLDDEGEVADYVHYHKVDFQLILCLAGRIRVVYEDQGPPFWLEPGDAVLQPPEMRHRVLESTGAAEVLEITMPAEHETWVEHEMELPTNELKTDRLFGTQPFVRLTGIRSVEEALRQLMKTVAFQADVIRTLHLITPLLERHISSIDRIKI